MLNLFKYFYNFIDKIKSKLSQKGQGMVEYALIIAFVAGIAAVALNTGLGDSIKNAFSRASTQIDNAGTSNSSSSQSSGSQNGGTE